MSTTQHALTVGEIARRVGAPVHRVEYLIRSRRIRCVAIAGNARIFSESDAALIASELQRIDADREGER